MFAFWKHETPCVGRTKRRRMRKLDALEDLLIERGKGSVSVFERDKREREERRNGFRILEKEKEKFV